MIQFEKARSSNANDLARISERAFHSDIDCGASAWVGLRDTTGWRGRRG
jgi:hypothetical protein